MSKQSEAKVSDKYRLLLLSMATLGSVFGLIAKVYQLDISQGIIWNFVAIILWGYVILVNI